MTITTRVALGSLLFEGGEGDLGFFISDDRGLSGWDDAPDVRRDAVAYAQAHGSYDLQGFRGSRLTTISGRCYSRNPQEQQLYRNRLAGLLADGQTGRVRVEHQGLTLWASVRLERAMFEPIIYGEIAQYQLQLWSADPRKYGDIHRFGPGDPTSNGGNLEMYHDGNFPAFPTFYVNGSAGRYAVYGPNGRRFLVTRALQPGHEHRIDMRTRQLFVDGIRVFGGVEEANGWTVGGGGKTPSYIDAPGGSVTLAAAVTDTYI